MIPPTDPQPSQMTERSTDLGVNQEESTASSTAEIEQRLVAWHEPREDGYSYDEAVADVTQFAADVGTLLSRIGTLQEDVTGWTRECYRASARAGAFRGCCEVADSVIDNTDASKQSAIWHEMRDWYVKARQSANEFYGFRNDS